MNCQGQHQRFFRDLALGAKVPRLVELAKSKLKEGMCVVIGLQSTGLVLIFLKRIMNESCDVQVNPD